MASLIGAVAHTRDLPCKQQLQIANRKLRSAWPTVAELALAVADPVATTQQAFERLSEQWARDTVHVSSTDDLTGHPAYQEIVQMGWDVVPLLLKEVNRKDRFWFPALAQITGIRPFDRRDFGNTRRIAEAWLRWGKLKGLI